MKKISFDGKWQLCGHEVSVPSLFVTKKVYDEFFTSLYADRAADVYVTDNESFTLKKEFILSEKDIESENAVLHFDRLDTLCNVIINGKKIAFCKNCHRYYDFDVKSELKKGKNELVIEFLSMTQYIEQKEKSISLPSNANGIPHHPHIRKPASHFGWDFTAPICVQGISGHSQLRLFSHPVIESLDVRQKKERESWSISATVKTSEKASIIFSLTYPDGRTEKVHADENMQCRFVVDDPQLWYCNTMGSQPLYTVSASVISDDGMTADKMEKRIGLRTLYLDKNEDNYGNSFRFYINGEPIFAKGANLVPLHMIYTGVTREDIVNVLQKAVDANMNMLRVWGGGFYESDEFYDLCDEMGILIWQDCAFACCAYPFMDSDFLCEVKEEIAQNVERIRHHASLCLWCGNNEIESMSLAWVNRRSFINTTGEFFYKTLPALINRYDGETPYHECSPGSGVYMKDPSGDSSGDSHIWNTWHGFRTKDYYKKRLSRFCSELGMQSYPNFPLTANQYCDLGEERLDFYLAKHFTLGNSEDERRYLTQILQLEYMQAAAEHFRRNPDRCAGILFWQLNDCWQSASWAALDVKHGKKAVMFGAKYFYENLHVSCEKEKNFVNIYITNENRESFIGKLTVFSESTAGAHGMRTEKTVFVRAFSSSFLMSIPLSSVGKKKNIFVARLAGEDGKVVSESRLILCENNELELVDPQLRFETVLRAGRVYVTVSAEKYARYVELSCRGETGDFSENYFDLCAGESKTVELLNPCAGLEEMLAVRSLFSVMKGKNSLRDKRRLLYVSSRPEVIANIVGRILGD